MKNNSLKGKIERLLRKGYFSGSADLVDVSEGDDGDLHVDVVSRKLDGRRMKEKHDLIWSELTRGLKPEEWGQISLTVGVSPEEVKAVY